MNNQTRERKLRGILCLVAFLVGSLWLTLNFMTGWAEIYEVSFGCAVLYMITGITAIMLYTLTRDRPQDE